VQDTRCLLQSADLLLESHDPVDRIDLMQLDCRTH
jgi:hypothetical protein